MPQIRALTGLAVDLLLTHAHPDHFGAAGEFDRIWLCEDDRETLACSEPLCHRFGRAAPAGAAGAFFPGRGEL